MNPSLFSDQQKFFSKLKNQGVNVILCRRQRIVDTNNAVRFKIKGDDVYLAVDMVAEAYDNNYDTAILVSGDGDFKPAVVRVKTKQKKVENYYFQTMSSNELTNKCDLTVPITKTIVRKHFCKFP